MGTGDRIRQLRKMRNLKPDQLGKMIGRDRASIYRYENGDIEKVPGEIIGPLAKALKTTPAYLLGISDDPGPAEPNTDPASYPAMITVPVYSGISCGTGNFVDEIPEDIVGIPSAWTTNGSTYFGNFVEGDSMEPCISDGECLIFKMTQVVEPGQIGAFSLNGEYFCKTLRKRDGLCYLESKNPNYDDIVVGPNDDFRILGLYKFKLSKEQ